MRGAGAKNDCRIQTHETVPSPSRRPALRHRYELYRPYRSPSEGARRARPYHRTARRIRPHEESPHRSAARRTRRSERPAQTDRPGGGDLQGVLQLRHRLGLPLRPQNARPGPKLRRRHADQLRTGLSGQNRSQRRHVRRSLPHPASGRHDPSGTGKQERILQRLPLLPLQTALRRRSRAQSPLPRFAAILQRAAHPQFAGRLRPAQGARSHDVLQGGGSPQGAGSAPARIRSRHRRHAPAGDGRLPAGRSSTNSWATPTAARST